MGSKGKLIPTKNKGKKSKKKLLRNILSLQDDNYWPLYPSEKHEELNEILLRELTILRYKRPNIPWSQLCKMSKEERKLTIQSNCDENSLKGLELRKYVTLGVNATCRRMEQGVLAFCLLEPTEDMVSQMVVSLSHQKRVPLALISGLKQLTKQAMGVPTLAIGFKTEVLEESCPLHGCSFIKDLIIDNIKIPETKKVNSNHQCEQTTNQATQERLFSKEEVHLMRPKDGGRAFVPENSTSRGDYIPLSSDIHSGVPEYTISNFKRFLEEEPSEEIKTNQDKKERVFQSPVVLAVRSNPHKRKKNS